MRPLSLQIFGMNSEHQDLLKKKSKQQFNFPLTKQANGNLEQIKFEDRGSPLTLAKILHFDLLTFSAKDIPFETSTIEFFYLAIQI